MTPAERMAAFVAGLQELAARTGVTLIGGEAGATVAVTTNRPVRLTVRVEERHGAARAILTNDPSALRAE